jgi:thiazole/oxazole-forming peptide maturase SagD family component
VVAVRHWSDTLSGRLLALDSRDLSSSTHTLVRQPQCPDCGDPAVMSGPARIRLDDAMGSGDAATAGQTYRALAHHVSEYLGVATRLVPLGEDDDDLFHAYSAAHSFVPSGEIGDLRDTLRGLSGGKGRSADRARMGALGESIERYCGVWRGDRSVTRGRSGDFEPGTALTLDRLHGFSERQYAERAGTNAAVSHFHRVPARLAEAEVLDWSPAWSISADQPRWLPACYCWYGHPDSRRLRAGGCDSNGCAAATSLASAVVSGFAELVERDAVALWWYHRSTRPGLDLDSFADGWIDRVRERFDTELDRDLWVLDVTADLELPTFAAVSAHRSRPTQDVLVGFGAAFDPRQALERSITELMQFLPTVARFEGGRTHYGMRNPEALRWFREARVEQEPWLRPSPVLPATTAGSYQVPAEMSPAALVKRSIAVADAAGLDVIVLDQSRPDIELAVARVVVPGLRHFWRRLGPGRLWEVPARLRRDPVATDEASVNPFDIFF